MSTFISVDGYRINTANIWYYLPSTNGGTFVRFSDGGCGGSSLNLAIGIGAFDTLVGAAQ